MKNVDYWKDVILKSDGKIAVSNNIPQRCADVKCSKCSFCPHTCTGDFHRWLYEEHVERPTLTSKEHKFCEILEDGYLARYVGRYGSGLHWYKYEPRKIASVWHMPDLSAEYDYIDLEKFEEMIPFKFITWEDEKPWSIKDLLALEVKDDPVTT